MYGNIDALKISKFVKSDTEIKNLMYTSVDNLNVQGPASMQSSYNFEGNTFDNINLNNPFSPRVNVYFERLNNLSGAGGYSEAPLIRQSADDPGLSASSFHLNSRMFHVINGTTVRDSILISGISGTNRVAVAVLMNHTSVNDLTLNLRAPNGTAVNFHSGTGSTNNDIMTVYDDLTDSLASNTLAPFSMRCRPVTSLLVLPQTNQNGYWRLSVTDAAGNADSGRVYLWGIRFISAVGVTTINNNIPHNFYLKQNYPNPFNPVTTIVFGLNEAAITRIEVFDITGKLIELVSETFLQPGNYSVNWNAGELEQNLLPKK
jgi:subtilisin-like proprotein convertase family protein